MTLGSPHSPNWSENLEHSVFVCKVQSYHRKKDKGEDGKKGMSYRAPVQHWEEGDCGGSWPAHPDDRQVPGGPVKVQRDPDKVQ